MPNHIAPLTSVRFVFAFMVLVCHTVAQLEQAGLARHSAIWNLISTGYVGVQFFFVLSGFILTYTYCNGHNKSSRRSFWIARFARIYPVYALGLFLVLPFVLYQAWLGNTNPASLAETGALQFTLTQAWVPSSALSWNAPGWSLSAEAFFYLAFPLLLPRIASLKTSYLIGVGAIAFLLSQLCALLVEVFALPGFSGIPATEHERAHSFWSILISCNPLIRLPEFVVGAVAALGFLRHGDAIRPYSGWLVAAPIACVLLILLFISPHIPIAALNTGGLMLFAAALFVGLATHTGTLTNVLSSKPLVRLGEASYAIYILHFPIGMWILWVIRRFIPSANEYPLTFFFTYIMIVIVASLIVFETFERPMRHAIRQWLRPKAHEVPAFHDEGETRSSPA